jgi:NAD(P)-dependent dehydrogenase (short-subunit alcohol dehydrogenase family)
MNLKDKVIIVTGATSGIGLEILKEALKLDALVMIHSSPSSESKAKELVNKYKNKTSYVVADLSKFNDLEKIISQTIEKFGRVDGLVNNAGVFPRNNITNINENDYEYIMNVNFKAPLFLSQKVVKVFLDKKIKGVIVNIGSINAYCGQDDLLVYSSSKGALMTLTRNMADFLGKYEIRVNQLNVGWVHTSKENETQLKEGQDKNWFKNINKAFAPRGTILSPQEIARHTVFWLSDYSSPISGSIYEVEQYPVIGRNKINA